ncbi:hypothetical protein LMG28727_06528 [Paraburkholderia kirstenboschensis]|uniref:hypothetical protein n=1 Tax=Paraburkholderia kirstenboschensis TaxID=1245436 RepID=UPI000AF077AD|nr:hypothetical protein [Paraburkholderia kirstenboschensis]CAD6558121.1 hypothetical protein LMG28727_06528 [Paraburkholderia kirstenboschensis]
MKKMILAALLSTAFVSAHATDGTPISKTITPPVAFIYSNGSGGTSITDFGVAGSDWGSVPPGAQTKLTKIAYQVTSYIGAGDDAPNICYYLPYTIKPAVCHPVTAGTSNANYTDFNALAFGNGAKVEIQHNISRSAPGANLKPASAESVTFFYSY